jgi:hypothetical protein
VRPKAKNACLDYPGSWLPNTVRVPTNALTHDRPQLSTAFFCGTGQVIQLFLDFVNLFGQFFNGLVVLVYFIIGVGHPFFDGIAQFFKWGD